MENLLTKAITEEFLLCAEKTAEEESAASAEWAEEETVADATVTLMIHEATRNAFLFSLDGATDTMRKKSRNISAICSTFLEE